MSDIKAMIEGSGRKVHLLQYRGEVLVDDDETLAEVGVELGAFMACVRGKGPRAQ